MTIDNASSNDICVDLSKSQLELVCDGDYLLVHCCSHVLNFIVKEGTKDLDELVFKVRE